MPVKIIANSGTTSPTKGEIREADLFKMKEDFDNEVSISAKPPRPVIYKRISFLFSKHQFDELFKTAPQADFVRVNIAVQIPGTTEICLNNESNAMAAIIEMAIKDPASGHLTIPVDGVGDSLLINGYQDNENPKFAAGCCPSSDPGHP